MVMQVRFLLSFDDPFGPACSQDPMVNGTSSIELGLACVEEWIGRNWSTLVNPCARR